MPFDPATRRLTLAATVLGSGLAFVDQTAVNVILPVLQQEFATDLASVQWVIEAYLLFLAALLLVGGALGDRHGRRRVFMLGVGLFAVASLACGLAPTVEVLTVFRAVQGVGAALLVPGSLALITVAFPEGERGKAFGVWTAMTGLTVAGGPVLGGFLAEEVTWRAVFFLNVPLAAVVLALLSRVQESRDEEARPLDVPGAALGTLGLGLVVLGLVEANARGFADPLVRGALLAGLAGLAGFVLWERRAPAPMLPPGLFRIRAFAGANLATLLVYAALSGALFFVPFLLIQVQGWSATWAGAASIPAALLLTTLSTPAGKLADRIGPRTPMVAGALTAALGYGFLATAGAHTSYWTTLFPGFALLGLGMAVLVPALTATVMGAVPGRHTGIASGVNNAVARTAGLLAIALFGLVAVQVFLHALPADTADLLGPEARKLAEARVPEGLGGAAAATVRADVEAAFVQAFRAAMGMGAVFALAGAALSALAVPGRKGAA